MAVPDFITIMQKDLELVLAKKPSGECDQVLRGILTQFIEKHRPQLTSHFFQTPGYDQLLDGIFDESIPVIPFILNFNPKMHLEAEFRHLLAKSTALQKTYEMLKAPGSTNTDQRKEEIRQYEFSMHLCNSANHALFEHSRHDDLQQVVSALQKRVQEYIVQLSDNEKSAILNEVVTAENYTVAKNQLESHRSERETQFVGAVLALMKCKPTDWKVFFSSSTEHKANVLIRINEYVQSQPAHRVSHCLKSVMPEFMKVLDNAIPDDEEVDQRASPVTQLTKKFKEM